MKDSNKEKDARDGSPQKPRSFARSLKKTLSSFQLSEGGEKEKKKEDEKEKGAPFPLLHAN